MSNDAMSLSGKPWNYTVILETILQQQDLGLFMEEKVNEKPCGNE